MRSRAALAVVGGLLLAGGPAAASPLVTLFNDYDSVFPGRCTVAGNVYACEQAVPEIRNGDNGRNTGQAEWNNGPNTGGPTSRVNISGTTGIWTGTPRDFIVSYDGDLLRLGVDLGTGFSYADYEVDLTSTTSMFIRAAARSGQTTVLADLVLDGHALGSLTGEGAADSLRINRFDWSNPWELTGTVTMFGASTGPSASPSVQFKLTNLDFEPLPPPPTAVPEPAALALLGLGLLGLAAVRGRRPGRAPAG